MLAARFSINAAGEGGIAQQQSPTRAIIPALGGSPASASVEAGGQEAVQQDRCLKPRAELCF